MEAPARHTQPDCLSVCETTQRAGDGGHENLPIDGHRISPLADTKTTMAESRSMTSAGVVAKALIDEHSDFLGGSLRSK